MPMVAVSRPYLRAAPTPRPEQAHGKRVGGAALAG